MHCNFCVFTINLQFAIIKLSQTIPNIWYLVWLLLLLTVRVSRNYIRDFFLRKLQVALVILYAWHLLKYRVILLLLSCVKFEFINDFLEDWDSVEAVLSILMDQLTRARYHHLCQALICGMPLLIHSSVGKPIHVTINHWCWTRTSLLLNEQAWACIGSGPNTKKHAVDLYIHNNKSVCF